MQSVSQKIRTGVLELRTPKGVFYASPSLRERLYLLWIFRHFRSLSRQVLGRGQQQLIDKLSKSATVWEKGQIARPCVIGAVENVAFVSVGEQQTAASSNVIPLPAAQPRLQVASAVGAEVRPPAPRKLVEANKVQTKSVTQPAPRITEIPVRRNRALTVADARQPVTSKPAAPRLTRKRLKWATGGALASALLGVVFYVSEVRSSLTSAVSRPAAESHPASLVAPPLTSPPARPENAPVSPTLQPKPVTAGVPVLPLGNARTKLPPDSSSPVVQELTSGPRVQIAGAPSHNFVYPEPPNSTLTGTVDLRALITADGVVQQVEVISGKPALARAAVQAMRRWRYTPPLSNGEPVDAETRVTVNFVGDDAVSITFPSVRD